MIDDVPIKDGPLCLSQKVRYLGVSGLPYCNRGTGTGLFISTYCIAGLNNIVSKIAVGPCLYLGQRVYQGVAPQHIGIKFELLLVMKNFNVK